MKIYSLIFITLILILLTACAPVTEEPPAETKEEVVMSTGDIAADVENDITDIGTLDSDLDMAELEDLDKDLEDIDW